MRKIFFSLLIATIALSCATTYKLWRDGANQPSFITVYGNVDVRQVDLAFRVFGRVEKLLYEEGDWVEPGDLVAILEKKPYTDQVVEAECSIASIEASLENEEKMLMRRKDLISSKSISQEDLDTVFSNYKVFKANLEQAKASLAVAQKNVVDTDIFAPTRGTILTRIREPGSVVNPSDPVYTLSIASPVWIRAFIQESELGLVYPGMSAKIYTDTPNGKVYDGKVGFISPVSEFTPKTVETTQLRTDLVYRIRVYADNPDLGLRQGMPVTVKLLLPEVAPQKSCRSSAISRKCLSPRRVKARGFEDRKLCSYFNIGKISISKSRELSRNRGDRHFREIARVPGPKSEIPQIDRYSTPELSGETPSNTEQ